MQFKQFLNESVVTQQGVFMLNEGIEHIEALPLPQFINAVKTLAKFQATEKLDGSNLIFGFDTKGKFYTSREAKGGAERLYKTSDYDVRAANNGFAAAHAALDKVKPQLKKVMKSGEACEVEVLFGRQPNAIVYGSNYIAFLRMLPGDTKETPDQSKTKKLQEELKGTTITTETPHVTTKDGVRIETETIKQKWKFASVSVIDSNKFTDVDVEDEIADLERFLEQKDSATGMKNGDLITAKLTSVPKDKRPAVKKAREDAIAHINDHFKLPIKEKFLNNILRVLQPALRDVEVSSFEDLGVEGVVLLNPHTLEQLKIVDKDVFTIINQFNYAIRNEIKATTAGRQTFTASLERDGDIFGDMLKKAADAVGIPDLGTYTKIKRVLRKYQGANEKETLQNFVKDFQTKDVGRLKTRVDAALQEGLHDLEDGRKKFLRDWKTYSLKLRTGKEVRYTEEIKNRTLMVFAEVKQEMDQMRQQVQSAETLGDVAVALYGRALNGIHK